MWHTEIPVNQDRLWDLRGPTVLRKILARNEKLCNEFVKNEKFQNYLRNSMNKIVELVIVDHFLQVYLLNIFFAPLIGG